MRLYFIAPGMSDDARSRGLRAAEAVFAEAGLSPLAAVRAPFQSTEQSVIANPAQLRAAHIWRTAEAAALKACYGECLAPVYARLMVAE